tara:strand:+ start:491 stop:1108 length:618 start_codon:yes stop_codon:yes gene_type:complete
MLENVFYINLKHRKDRKRHVENELNKLGWKYERFNAIKNKDGRLGCSMSHLKLLEMAKTKQLEYIVIIEDDIEFKNHKLYNEKLNRFFNKKIDYDVLMIAGNIRKPIEFLDNETMRIKKSFTTTGYIVKQNYYDKLINNIKRGVNGLIRYPGIKGKFEIDVNWFELQANDTWLLLYPRTVSQMKDYSDIEKTTVSYEHLMLDNIK